MLASFILAAAATGAGTWHLILWLIAAALVIYGIYVAVARRAVVLGIVLILLGLLIGPGGVSILS